MIEWDALDPRAPAQRHLECCTDDPSFERSVLVSSGPPPPAATYYNGIWVVLPLSLSWPIVTVEGVDGCTCTVALLALRHPSIVDFDVTRHTLIAHASSGCITQLFQRLYSLLLRLVSHSCRFLFLSS